MPAIPAALNTKTVTLRHDARWICPHSGDGKCGGKGWNAELLPDVAARAIRAGVAAPEYSEEATRLRRERGAAPIGDPTAINLDDETVAPPKAPERWIGPSGISRYEPPPIKTSAPLSSWTGQHTPAWTQPHGPRGGE